MRHSSQTEFKRPENKRERIEIRVMTQDAIEINLGRQLEKGPIRMMHTLDVMQVAPVQSFL